MFILCYDVYATPPDFSKMYVSENIASPREMLFLTEKKINNILIDFEKKTCQEKLDSLVSSFKNMDKWLQVEYERIKNDKKVVSDEYKNHVLKELIIIFRRLAGIKKDFIENMKDNDKCFGVNGVQKLESYQENIEVLILTICLIFDSDDELKQMFDGKSGFGGFKSLEDVKNSRSRILKKFDPNKSVQISTLLSKENAKQIYKMSEKLISSLYSGEKEIFTSCFVSSSSENAGWLYDYLREKYQFDSEGLDLDTIEVLETNGEIQVNFGTVLVQDVGRRVKESLDILSEISYVREKSSFIVKTDYVKLTYKKKISIQNMLSSWFEALSKKDYQIFKNLYFNNPKEYDVFLDLSKKYKNPDLQIDHCRYDFISSIDGFVFSVTVKRVGLLEGDELNSTCSVIFRVKFVNNKPYILNEGK